MHDDVKERPMISIQSPCSLLVPSGLFPLLQDTRVKRRRLGLPAAIRPLPSVSGGLEGAGDGGGTANRRAAVNRLGSLVSRSSSSSPSASRVEERPPGVALLPRCRRISLQGGPGASATSLLLRGVSADGGGGMVDSVSGYGVHWS